MSKNFLKSSAILIVGSTIANAGSYFFHLALGRILSPAEYGTLGALLSVYIIMSVPVSAIQNTSAKIFAHYHDKIYLAKSAHEKFFGRVFQFSLLVFVLYNILAFWHYDWFGFENPWGLFFIGLCLLYIFQLAWVRGITQGLLNFEVLSWSMVIEGIGKITFGIILGYYFLRGDIAALSMTFSFGISYLFIRYYVGRLFRFTPKNNNEKMAEHSLYKESLRMSLGILGIMFFISIDTLMAKKYLPADQAGFYTALSTLGKIVFFAPSSVASALFPYTTKETNKLIRLDFLKKALMIVLGMSLIIVVGYYLWPNLIFSILFGNKYVPYGNLLALIGVTIGVVAFAQVIVNYLLSQKGWTFAYALLITAICQFTAYQLWHENVTQMVMVGLGSSVVLLISTVWVLVRRERV